MKPQILILAAVFFGAALAGCAPGNQARGAYKGGIDRETAELSIYRHGRNGLEVERYFNSTEIRDRTDPMRGKSYGYVPVEFYTIEAAKDPAAREILTLVGYARRIEEERRGEFLYEFYDDTWQRLAWLNPRGELFSYGRTAGDTVYHGNYLLEGAAYIVFSPPSGYGYDGVNPDLNRTRGTDTEVSGATPDGRGVVLRQHKGNEPKLIISPVSAGRADEMRRALDANVFNARVDAELDDARKRVRGEDVDGDVGGIPFKDGQPVDADGKPIKRGEKYLPPGR